MAKSTRLRNYMPRSLFGRALLILLLPIVALQGIVAAGFIQRHFDGVTGQLAKGVALETTALISQIETDGVLRPQTEALAQTLGLTIRLSPDDDFEPGFRNYWYDLSGRTIHTALSEVLGRPLMVDLQSNVREARISAQTTQGVIHVVAPRKRMSASNPHQLLVIMTFSALVLTLISILFLRNQVRPIARLADAAEAFGKGRVATYRPAGADEVRRAGLAFMSMRQRIERHLEQRTLMLSGVSHDLRTPLTRMRLGIATATDADDLAALTKDIEDMEAMIDSFIEFARDTSIEAAQPVDPVKLVAAVVKDTPQARDRLKFNDNTQRHGPMPLRVQALRRAVQNLINNALRYADLAEVTVEMSASALVIAVEDNGPGIPPEDAERATRAFTRLDVARNQDAGAGSGLGLAIVLDVARAHGGQLMLHKSARLGGLKASLSLPR